MIRLYDAHNHLQDERFAGQTEKLIAAARAEGLTAMVVNGSGVEDWPAVAALARAHPDIVIPSFGVHPWYAHEQPADWMDQLAYWLREFPAAGVGEIGLDRWKPDLPWDGQREVFEAQLRLAADLNRPASIHCLQAWGALVETLDQTARPMRGILLHSYGGSAELVARLLPMGAHFSFPGYFADARKARQQEAFRAIPLERLLIETDAPDQPLPDAFVAHPLADTAGKPINHPANIAGVYAFVAQLRGLTLDALATRVEDNFRRLFG